MKSLTREEVRRVDAIAINQLGIPGIVLMENAGRNAAAAIMDLMGGPGEGREAWIFAGTGNNGGDGFVIARHLMRCGVKVKTILVGEPARLTPDARVNYDILLQIGGEILPFIYKKFQKVLLKLPKDGLFFIDSLGGTGISGSLRGQIAEAVEWLNAQSARAVAVDIPTGLDCDTGRAEGPAVKAELTVTFVARKIGFDNPDSKAYTGKVVVADIGIDPAWIETAAGA